MSPWANSPTWAGSPSLHLPPHLLQTTKGCCFLSSFQIFPSLPPPSRLHSFSSCWSWRRFPGIYPRRSASPVSWTGFYHLEEFRHLYAKNQCMIHNINAQKVITQSPTMPFWPFFATVPGMSSSFIFFASSAVRSPLCKTTTCGSSSSRSLPLSSSGAGVGWRWRGATQQSCRWSMQK